MTTLSHLNGPEHGDIGPDRPACPAWCSPVLCWRLERDTIHREVPELFVPDAHPGAQISVARFRNDEATEAPGADITGGGRWSIGEPQLDVAIIDDAPDRATTHLSRRDTTALLGLLLSAWVAP